MIASLGAGLYMLSLGAAPGEWRRLADVGIAPGLATPEAVAICVSAHPTNPTEVGLCGGFAARETTLELQGVARKSFWNTRDAVTGKGFQLAFGPGLGIRYTRYCPFKACANAAGAEALISLEAILWLGTRFGLSMQADGGLAFMWSQTIPQTVEASWVAPGRLTLGVAF